MTSRRQGFNGFNFARAGLAFVALAGLMLALAAPSSAAANTLAWSPETSNEFNFGTLDASLRQTASQTFTLTNSGVASVVTVKLSGWALSKTADNCSGKILGHNQSCAVTVKFAPKTNGSTSGRLRATSQSGAIRILVLTGASAWKAGDETTNGQADWAASNVLVADFNTVYAIGRVAVGLPSPGFSMTFTGANHVQEYLPASGAAGPLTANLSDPTTSSSGVFGGDVLALRLNVDFNNAGFLKGASKLKFGNLKLCNFTTLTDLNRMTVLQFLGVVNTALGGGSTTDSIADLSPITFGVNLAFLGGSPSTFAQEHLFPGACRA
jgi:hypothetical protein